MKQLLSLRTVWAVAALVGLLAFALPAFAGGWAVVTLDHLPDQVIAGQPVNVGFVVRQHGITPLGGLKPVIRLQKAGEANSKAVPVASDGNTGHYSATLTNFSADPDYLAKWLDDPASIKPNTYMPKLDLSDEEIGALATFVNAP